MAIDEPDTFRVALLSMPWALFNRPSIQLGTLKAHLETDKSIKVSTLHPCLDTAHRFGTKTYRLISKDSWAGEALYAPLLFPEQYGQAKHLFLQRMKKRGFSRHVPDYDKLQEELQKSLEIVVDKIHTGYDLVGLSVCFNQLFASLLVAKLLKERNSDPAIVFGGSSCVGKMGHSLLDNFPWIDFVIDGEGEKPLHRLCRFLAGRTSRLSRQIVSRTGNVPSVSDVEIKDLNRLSPPDYEDYFTEMNSFFQSEPFIPTLPIEFSRGCWWNKCTFCNLNLQWRHYRSKSSDRCIAEVKMLAKKHHCLSFTFTDNALPLKESDSFFNRMAEEEVDYRFFAEIRAITDRNRIKQYRLGGLSSIQVGIEGLSSSLLKRLGKGTTAIDNIAVMRNSAESGITLDGNLIIEFPGSTEEEVDETLHALDFVLPYHPLISASFFLGHGSPVYNHPKIHGIQAVTHHPNNRKLFPQHILKKMELLIRGYRGDRQAQRSLWKPVVKKLLTWHSFHITRQKSDIAPLSYRDGGSFCIVRQELTDGNVLQHRLKATSRSIYLYCTTIRTLDEIADTFNRIPVAKIQTFLDDLTKKHLVFCEKNRYLSLAIHQK